MPKTTQRGDARQSELPSTLRRSDDKAQRTFAKAYDSAMDEFGDHWQPKEEAGPSDRESRRAREEGS